MQLSNNELKEIEVISSQAQKKLKEAGIESLIGFGQIKNQFLNFDFSNLNNIYQMVDYTNLKPSTTTKEIIELIEGAKKLNCKTVCINNIHLRTAVKQLENSSVQPIVVEGFPLGALNIESLTFNISNSIMLGAKEIDIVIPVGFIKEQNYQYVLEYLMSVKNTVSKTNTPVKVILETALLSKEEIAISCLLVKKAQLDFVKTSTGFSTSGANLFDVALMRYCVGDSMGVKASGGIKNLNQALDFINVGATRIGASNLSNY